MTQKLRIGILTGGGDAPGLNPAIKAVVQAALSRGFTAIGIHDGWAGLLGDTPEVWPLDELLVQPWDRDGGTHLGSSRTNPFARRGADGEQLDLSDEAVRNLGRLGLDALV